MTTDIPTELDEALDAEAGILTTMEQLAHVRADLETFMAEMTRLQTWIEANVGADAQLGDNPVDFALRVMSRQRAAIERLMMDGEYIAKALRAEAEEREWCDEFEAFVSRVNDGLQEMALLPCRRSASVELRVHVNIRVTDDDYRDEAERLRSNVFSLLNGDDEVQGVTVAVNE